MHAVRLAGGKIDKAGQREDGHGLRLVLVCLFDFSKKKSMHVCLLPGVILVGKAKENLTSSKKLLVYTFM
jgi:hypothetical protein